MNGKTKFLRKQAIAHLVRAVAGVSGQSSFVMIGTGAVIAQLKHVPLDLMRTREIDIYPRGVPHAEDIATLIDGPRGKVRPSMKFQILRPWRGRTDRLLAGRLGGAGHRLRRAVSRWSRLPLS